jgi:tetratricopeptide (TPR) repeat protein
MGLVNLIIVAVMGAAIGMSTRYFSPGELQDRFENGQKFYALGDYNAAIDAYRKILETKSNILINIDEAMVNVDEFLLPIRVASTYQLGNSHKKLGLDKLQRSKYLKSEGNLAEAEERYNEARSDLNKGIEYFRRIVSNTGIEERTRVMAQYQIVETSYELEDYKDVIESGRELLNQFPNSLYESTIYYDIGWAYLNLGEYEKAIENLKQVLTLSPTGQRSDRAMFQIGEAYGRLHQYDEALKYFQRLVDRYDFSKLSEKELAEMVSLKLKGVVQETPRELVAKAQIKIGDIYSNRDDYEKARDAYAVVPAKYPQETALVEDSYVRNAELERKRNGVVASMNAYRRAIEHTTRREFHANAQLQIANLLFEDRQYEEAIKEYDVYLKAYGDITYRIGFGTDKARFRIAECYRDIGRTKRTGDPATSREAFGKAAGYYRGIVEEFGRSDLVPDAIFGLGLSLHATGESQEALSTYQNLLERFPKHPAAPNALLQIARIYYERKDYPQAISSYSSLVERYGESDVRNIAEMERGIAYRAAGEMERAIETFEKVDPTWEQWPQVQVEIAELYTSHERYDDAQAKLNAAIGRVTDRKALGQLHFIKGRIFFAREQYDEAIVDLSKAIEMSDDPEVLESAIFTRGTSYYRVAKKLDTQNETRSATERYEASLKDLQTLLSRSISPKIKDTAYRILGASMIRLGRQQEAVSYYEQIIQAAEDPQERASFQFLLMELYNDMENLEKVIESGRTLIAMEFQDSNTEGFFKRERAYALIGNAFFQQKRYDEAIATFTAGLKHYPNSSESSYMLFSKAFSELSKGDYEASARDFDLHLKTYPKDQNAIHARYYLAHSYQALGQLDRAAPVFYELAQRYPKSEYEAEALFLSAENFYDSRMFDRAEDAYKKFLAGYPDDQRAAVAQYGLAWSYYERNSMESMVTAMSTLVARYPQSEYAPKAQFTLGDYYYSVKDYPRATAAYSVLVDRYPSSVEAEKSRSLIAELGEIQASMEYDEVMKKFDDKEYEEAIQGFKQVIEKYPNSYTAIAALCNIGMAYENMDQWKKAKEIYDQIIEKGGNDPNYADAVDFAKEHRRWIVEKRL